MKGRTRSVGIVVGLLAGLALLAWAARRNLPSLVGWTEGLEEWGPLGFILVYALSTVALVPASFFTVAAGVLFGLARGTLYAFVAATLGSTLAFLTARHLARKRVEEWLEGDARFQRVDRAIGREGLRVVFLLRLSPVLPFTLLNYALGLTRVRLMEYLLGAIGMLPGTLLYVYAGLLVGEVAALSTESAPPRGPAYYGLLGLGLVATVAVVVLITRTARRALKEETDDEEPSS